MAIRPEEKAIMDPYLLALPSTSRRFRIDAGEAWIADKAHTLHIKKPTTLRLYPGDLVLRHPQVFQGGPPGWWDLVGWDEVTILPSDVPPEGLKLAVFVGDEVKSPNDRLKPAQRALGGLLAQMGGRWRIVRAEGVEECTMHE